MYLSFFLYFYARCGPPVVDAGSPVQGVACRDAKLLERKVDNKGGFNDDIGARDLKSLTSVRWLVREIVICGRTR